jgi:nicotinamidase-related amidase
MSAITIDKQSALVLIDPQQGILAPPALLDPDDIKTRDQRLAAASRASTLPVAQVKLAFSADGGDLPPGRALMPGRESAPPAAYSEFPRTSPLTPATSSWSSGIGGRSPERGWTSSSAAAA